MRLLISDSTYFVIGRHGIYFRVLDYGLAVSSHRRNAMLFSERSGYVKAWHPFGKKLLCIRFLTPRY